MSDAELEAVIALCSMMSVDDDFAPPAPKKRCVEAVTPPKEKGNSKGTIVPKSSTCQAASSILPTKNSIDIKKKYANQEPSTSFSGN
ncbi:Protein CBG28020 [Caenorhabditis briggsae]|nr:Protein CBG28020 [Caenorhabditis briggsae]CAR98846.1 Protein CBG28020 [Caenorhabditis briggsae]